MAEMQNVPVGQRAAKFVSAVCLILPDGRELVCDRRMPRQLLALTPAGDNGFGYDPLFVPDAVGLPGGGTVPNTAHRTYAELADAEKDAISTAAAPWKSWKPGSPHFWANEPQRKTE